MIDLDREDVLSLREAARELPRMRQGHPVAFQTVLRWITTGTRTRDGRMVRLEALRIGCRWVTSRQAIRRFADDLTAQYHAAPAAAGAADGNAG